MAPNSLQRVFSPGGLSPGAIPPPTPAPCGRSGERPAPPNPTTDYRGARRPPSPQTLGCLQLCPAGPHRRRHRGSLAAVPTSASGTPSDPSPPAHRPVPERAGQSGRSPRRGHSPVDWGPGRGLPRGGWGEARGRTTHCPQGAQGPDRPPAHGGVLPPQPPLAAGPLRKDATRSSSPATEPGGAGARPPRDAPRLRRGLERASGRPQLCLGRAI